jgi:hypothetical protein
MVLPVSCSRPVAIAAALSIMLTSLGGCAGMGGPASGLKPLAVDPSDGCHVQRMAFNDSPYFMRDTVVRNAAIGTLGGAVAGGLIGGLAGGGRGAAIGAIGGAVAGMVAGLNAAYWQQLQQNAQDQAMLASQFNQDLRATGTNIDHSAVAFSQLRSCRFAQAAQIKSLARRKVITRDIAIIELSYQKDRFQEEIAMARAYGVNMGKQSDQFQYASEQIVKTAPQVHLAATETIPEKRKGFETAIDNADTSGKIAFDIDSTAKVPS